MKRITSLLQRIHHCHYDAEKDENQIDLEKEEFDEI